MNVEKYKPLRQKVVVLTGAGIRQKADWQHSETITDCGNNMMQRSWQVQQESSSRS